MYPPQGSVTEAQGMGNSGWVWITCLPLATGMEPSLPQPLGEQWEDWLSEEDWGTEAVL